MPRIRRMIPTDLAMHIMCRGNNKQVIFLEQQDKQRYCSLLLKLKKENNIDILHYCLMNNHVHLIILLNAATQLSRFMKQVNLSYFNYYNKRYGYTGHFWQDRFKSSIIDTDAYLLQCGKYIELNPVRAKMVSLPGQYCFSSYAYYAYGAADALVTPSPVYPDLSESEEERRMLYARFVVNLINKEILAKRCFIGSDIFVNKLQEFYSLKNEKRVRGRPKKTKNAKNAEK